MGFLKGLALAFLGLLLSLSLTLFGIAFTLNNTVLNADFVNSQIDSLDIAAIIDDIATEQIAEGDLTPELRTSLNNILLTIEQYLEGEVSAAIDDIYAYLLGERPDLELAQIIQMAIPGPELVSSLVDDLDLSTTAKELLDEQIIPEIPPEAQFLTDYLSTALVETVTELEPWIKEQVEAVVYPVADYLLGISPTLNESITLDIVKDTLRDNLWDAFLASPPQLADLPPEVLEQFFEEFWPMFTQNLPPALSPEKESLKDPLKQAFLESPPPSGLADLAPAEFEQYFNEFWLTFENNIPPSLEPVKGTIKDTLRDAFHQPMPGIGDLPQADLEQAFNEVWQEFADNVPSTFDIDQELIGADMPADIAQAIDDAEDGLGEAREYISIFQNALVIAIIFMLLLVGGIILIHRNVRGATRGLGIIFLIYGAFTYAAVLIGKTLAETRIPLDDIPTSLQAWVPSLFDGLLAPLEMLSIGFIVAAVVLLIVSFFYKRPTA